MRETPRARPSRRCVAVALACLAAAVGVARPLAAAEEPAAELRARVEVLEAEREELRARLQALEEQAATHEAQDADLLAAELAGGRPAASSFAVYGFYDLTFGRYFLADGSAFHLGADDASSFWMSNLNVYLDSPLSETFSSLIELRFSFLPDGAPQSYPVVLRSPAAEVPVPGSFFRRADTAVKDPLTSEQYELGGVSIVRAQLTWAPRDWLQVVLGRFITPFGIWNVDHGSPVVTPTRLPYFQIHGLVPRAQLGVQVRGTLFPSPGLALGYALTVSNGRGPADAVADLDDHKGLGLRLELDWRGEEAHLRVGGYGYWGTYRDERETVFVELVEGMKLASENPFTVTQETTAAFEELIGTADVLLEGWGLRVQGEFAWRRVVYDVPPLVSLEQIGVPAEAGMFVGYFAADFVEYATYGLVAWELPLARWIAPVRIAPYLMVEWGDGNQRQEWVEGMLRVTAGLNVKPTSFLTLKAEYSAFWSLDRSTGGERLHFAGLQAAVAF